MGRDCRHNCCPAAGSPGVPTRVMRSDDRTVQTELTLVTGATGFTGSHLVHALVSDGDRVRVIARSAARAREHPARRRWRSSKAISPIPTWSSGRRRV